MNGNDAYRLELQWALELSMQLGDIEAAETYQQMIDQFDEYQEG